MKTSIFLFTLLSIPFSAVNADEAGFAAYDKDRDGTVTYAELGKEKKLDFDRLDRNRDKNLSEAEFAAAEKKEDAPESLFDTPEFAALDADKNGQLSLAEFGTSIKNMIASMDKSSDSAVSKDEYLAAEKAMAAAVPAGSEKKGSAAKKGSAVKKGTPPKPEAKKTDS